MKAFSIGSIDWSGTVSWHGTMCLKFGLNPDVEELERYNTEAEQAACTHPVRRHIILDVDGSSYWSCGTCQKRPVDAPPFDKGRLRLSGTVWEATP